MRWRLEYYLESSSLIRDQKFSIGVGSGELVGIYNSIIAYYLSLLTPYLLYPIPKGKYLVLIFS